jgi:uncharacterized protein YecE (DUF72 family)
MGEFRVGASGYNYPHWRGVLYPEGLPQRRWLEHYAEHFDTVELNVTFYRLPKGAVFEGWHRRVPDGFLFAVKGSKLITHLKRLADCEEAVVQFREATGLLVEKRGPMLRQLPPSFKKDVNTLSDFITLLGSQFGSARHAFEFRDLVGAP